MRKIIFIGQSGDKAVYYNTRTKEALVADKSALLNTEGARRSNRGIAPLIAIFSLLGLLQYQFSQAFVIIAGWFLFLFFVFPLSYLDLYG